MVLLLALAIELSGLWESGDGASTLEFTKDGKFTFTLRISLDETLLKKTGTWETGKAGRIRATYDGNTFFEMEVREDAVLAETMPLSGVEKGPKGPIIKFTRRK